MNTSTYRNLLRVLEKWPLEPVKPEGKEFGQFIRKEIAISFRSDTTAGERKLDLVAWDSITSSLNRILSDQYKKRHTLSGKTFTATGLTSTECSTALSSEFEKILKEEETSIFTKISRRIRQK